MSLHLGSNDISKLYLGSQEVEKAYLGAVQVFPEAAPAGPIVINELSQNKYKNCEGYMIVDSNETRVGTDFNDSSVAQIIGTAPYFRMYTEVQLRSGVRNNYHSEYSLYLANYAIKLALGYNSISDPTLSQPAFKVNFGDESLSVTVAEIYTQLLNGSTNPADFVNTFFGITFEGTRGGNVELTVTNLYTGAGITKTYTDSSNAFKPIQSDFSDYYALLISPSASNKTHASISANSLQMDFGNSANDILVQYRPNIPNDYTTKYTGRVNSSTNEFVVSAGLGTDSQGSNIFVPTAKYAAQWIADNATTSDVYQPVYLHMYMTNSGTIAKVQVATYSVSSTETRKCVYIGILYCVQGNTTVRFNAKRALVHIQAQNEGLAASYSITHDRDTVNSNYALVPLNSTVRLQVQASGYASINETRTITDYVNHFYYYMMRSATDQRICVSDARITRNEAGEIEFGEVNDPFLYIEHPFKPKDLAVNDAIGYQIQFRDSVEFKMGFFENWSEKALKVPTLPEFNNGAVLAKMTMVGQPGKLINLNMGGVLTTGVVATVQLTRTAEDSYRIVIMRAYNMDTEPVMDTVWDETYTQQDWAQIFPGQSYYFFITSAGGLSRIIPAKITGGIVNVGSEIYNWRTTATIDVGV